jgi:hypothetical protein
MDFMSDSSRNQRRVRTFSVTDYLIIMINILIIQKYLQQRGLSVT